MDRRLFLIALLGIMSPGILPVGSAMAKDGGDSDSDSGGDDDDDGQRQQQWRPRRRQ